MSQAEQSAAAIERIETERLVCERLRPEHSPEVTSLLLDPRVARTLWPTLEPPTERDVVEGMAGRLEHWERYGFGLWLLRDRRTGEFVGRGGFSGRMCRLAPGDGEGGIHL